MMQRALHRQISRSELETMRESGMTNQQIADSLGVSYPTVLRIIGKQPVMLTSQARSEGQRARWGSATNEQRTSVLGPSEAPSEPAETCLLVDEQIIRAAGVSGVQYTLSSKSQTVQMQVGGGTISLRAADLLQVAKELGAVARQLNKQHSMEGWA